MSDATNSRPEYHGPEKRWQPAPSRVPKFLREYVVIWVLGIVGAAVWFGGIAYIDTRHVQREEFTGYIHAIDRRLEAMVYRGSETRLLDKVETAEGRVLELQLYNRFGEPSRNRQARDQMISQKKTDIKGWNVELKSLADARAAPM